MFPPLTAPNFSSELRPAMDVSDQIAPAMERIWIDEVRHLHALWHAGPPSGPTLPPPSGSHQTHRRLQLRKKKKAFKRQQKKTLQLSSNWPSPDPETPDDDILRSWDDVKVKTAATPKPLSEEDKARIVSIQVQKDCVEASKAFFSNQCSSDDEDDGDDDEDRGLECFKFFEGFFERDEELRGLYRRTWEKGEFCCVVCEAIGERKGRRFPDCVSMLQHLNSISRTKRRTAHRALAKVVCRILGWDMERLPSIVPVADKREVGSNDTPTLSDGSRVEQKEEVAVEVAKHAKTDNDGETMDCDEKEDGGVEQKVEPVVEVSEHA